MSQYILPIKQINTNFTNSFIPLCTENAFATVCEYLGIEYQYAFAYATNFSFSENFCSSGRVADGIFTSYNFIKQFEEVYNTVIEQKQFSFFNSYIKYLTNMLADNTPVIAHFDSYYIPWSTLYKVRHTSHLVIVIGIDTYKKILTILDPIDLDEPTNITYRDFKKGSHFCLEMESPEKIQPINTEHFISHVQTSNNALIHTNMFNSLHKLATCIQNIFDPYIEFRDCHNHSLMLEEKFVDDIRKLMQSINVFIVWLQWFSKHNVDYDMNTVIEEFKSILSKWNVLLNMIYKRSLTSWENGFKDKFSQFIDNIATMHETAYADLISCLQTQYINKEDLSISQNFGNSTIIDLTKHFNNKGFSLAKVHGEYCDLTGAGEYFSINTQCTNNIFNVNNIEFKIAYDSKYDNIVCNGQLIELENTRNSVGIAIICCSEWGRANDMIELSWSDGSSKRFAIYVNDLPECDTPTSCLVGQTFDVNGKLIQERAALTINHFFYDERKLTSIKLPQCPNMHILAISLLYL